MLNRTKVFSLAVACSFTVFLSACATKDPGFYRHSPTIGVLEIPPDLTRPDFQDNFEIPQIGALLAKEPLLSDGSKVKLNRDGRLRWLTITAQPNVVWEYVRDFWNSRQVMLAWENINAGTMETDWIKNYDTRFAKDRFRVRVEPGKAKGTTDLFIIHRGVQQVAGDLEPIPVWDDRLSDPELELEVIAQMLEFFSLEQKRKQQIIDEAKQTKAESTLKLNDVPPALVVHDPVDRTWDFVMLAVERMGHRIDSRDKATSVMVIKASPTGDGITPDIFKREERFNLRVKKEGENDTRIVIEADQGSFSDPQAMRNFLIRLKENL